MQGSVIVSNTNLSVAIQGELGAYHEAATIEYYGRDVTPVPCGSFDEVFRKVSTGEVDRGMIAIENSLFGSIHQNYDLLLRNELTIVGEVQVRIAHQLMVLPGVKASDITHIYSQQPAIGQCERSIKAHFPNAECVFTHDTAGSARILRDKGLRNAAAIASTRAAELYNMEILYPDFEDDPENYTRFLAINREPIIPEGEAKTSVVYALQDSPGALFRSLAVFSLRDIDLTKIESRPLQGKRWQYFFYLDLVGSQHDVHCQYALNNLQEMTTYFKILGSYPKNV